MFWSQNIYFDYEKNELTVYFSKLKIMIIIDDE